MSEQLCLILTDTDLSWAVVDTQSKKAGSRGRIEFNGKLDRLREDVGAHPDLQRSYDSTSLAYGGDKSTLCPMDVKSDLGAGRVAQLNFGDKEDSDYNLLMELGLCNIFVFPDHLKRFAVTKFPSANHFHLGTVLIKGVLQGTPFFPKLHMAKYGKDGLLIAFTYKNKVVVYNHFTCESQEDAVYFGLSVLSGLDFERREAKVCFYGNWEGNNTSEITEKLIGSPLNKVEEPDFLFTSQLHCV